MQSTNGLQGSSVMAWEGEQAHLEHIKPSLLLKFPTGLESEYLHQYNHVSALMLKRWIWLGLFVFISATLPSLFILVDEYATIWRYGYVMPSTLALVVCAISSFWVMRMAQKMSLFSLLVFTVIAASASFTALRLIHSPVIVHGFTAMFCWLLILCLLSRLRFFLSLLSIAMTALSCVVLAMVFDVSLTEPDFWQSFFAFSATCLFLGYLQEYRDREGFLSRRQLAQERNAQQVLHDSARKQAEFERSAAQMLSEIGSTESASEIANKAISYMVRATSASAGAIYLCEGDTLICAGSWALSRPPSETLAFGESLVGQVAENGKAMTLSNVPGQYMHIVSGTGSIEAGHLHIEPVYALNALQAVFELGQYRDFDDDEIALVQRLGDTLGIVLASHSGRKAS